MHENFTCKKTGIFQIKFSILTHQSLGLLIKINLAWSKFSCGATTCQSAFFSAKIVRKQKKNDLNLIFSLARTLCKSLALITVVNFSHPNSIMFRTLTKQKIKKMTHSYKGTRLQISYFSINFH